MKNDCSVVKDLIPLYAEGLVSSETKEFIYEHCQSNFSENDINAAAEEVKQYFKNNFGGCVLLRLSYDEENTLDQEWHREYSEAICFKSDYYMLKEPVAGVMNRNRNNWNWMVLHDSDGSWRVVNYGYC